MSKDSAAPPAPRSLAPRTGRRPGSTGPCPLSLSSLNCGNWHPNGAPPRGALGSSVPMHCASRRAQLATPQGSRSRAGATASSRRGPLRTRGVTCVATSSGASCARVCSARVSSGPKSWRERNGQPRDSPVAEGQVAMEGVRGDSSHGPGPLPLPHSTRECGLIVYNLAKLHLPLRQANALLCKQGTTFKFNQCLGPS